MLKEEEPKLKIFVIRKDCEYVQEVRALNEADAWTKIDDRKWEKSWSETEIDELEPEEE